MSIQDDKLLVSLSNSPSRTIVAFCSLQKAFVQLKDEDKKVKSRGKVKPPTTSDRYIKIFIVLYTKKKGKVF